jgi:MoaA/NifB/PqqE/SkfB family radical SAM enzyme
MRLIDEMDSAGTVRLGLWGGEPLLREDIGQIVSHAAAKGMYVTLDTNGLLWKQRRGELKDLEHLMISLDGDRAGHEANRGAGTFDRTLEAIELAAADPALKVWTLTVLTRHNLKDIDFILQTAERLGLRSSFQVLHHNDKLGRNHQELIPSNEEYRAAIRYLLRRKKEGARISSSSRYLNYLLRWDDYAAPKKKWPHCGLRCKAGALYCNVDANGKVYGCSLLADEEPAVSALEVGFQEAFRAIPAVPCQGCIAACFTEYNYLYRLDPVCIYEWIRSLVADK